MVAVRHAPHAIDHHAVDCARSLRPRKVDGHAGSIAGAVAGQAADDGPGDVARQVGRGVDLQRAGSWLLQCCFTSC